MNMPQENNLITTILQGATLGKRKPRGKWSDNVIEWTGIFFKESNRDIRRERVRCSAAILQPHSVIALMMTMIMIISSWEDFMENVKCSLSSLSTKVSCQWRDLLKISGGGTENREELILFRKSIKLHQRYNLAIMLSVSSWWCVQDLSMHTSSVYTYPANSFII